MFLFSHYHHHHDRFVVTIISLITLIISLINFDSVFGALSNTEAEAKNNFCNTTHWRGLYYTGYYYKAVDVEDETLLNGTVLHHTRALTFVLNHVSKNFAQFEDKIEKQSDPRFYDFVAFTGVYLDNANLFIEFSFKQKAHIGSYEIIQHQVSCAAFAKANSANSRPLASSEADAQYWHLCDAHVIDEGCFAHGGQVRNSLFPVRLLKIYALQVPKEKFYSLIFIKTRFVLIHLEKNFRITALEYYWVSLNDTTRNVTQNWKKERISKFDDHLIGAIEYVGYYYLVVKMHNATNRTDAYYLRQINDLDQFPKFTLSDHYIPYKDFFQCGQNVAPYYSLLSWATIFAFVLIFLLTVYFVTIISERNKVKQAPIAPRRRPRRPQTICAGLINASRCSNAIDSGAKSS